MKLIDLFRDLSFGELSSLSMSNEGSGSIKEASQPRLIAIINTALTEMFTRTVFEEKEILVQTKDWKSIYYLRKEYAKMDPTKDVMKYILDTPKNPFKGDLVRVLEVRNEVGNALPLNDAEQYASVFTPYYDTIQFTHPGADQVFAVRYQSLHPTVVSTADKPEDVLNQNINLPPIFWEILRLRIASGIFAGMSGQEYSVKAQALQASYESKYAEIEQKNLAGDSGQDTNVKIYHRGFP